MQAKGILRKRFLSHFYDTSDNPLIINELLNKIFLRQCRTMDKDGRISFRITDSDTKERLIAKLDSLKQSESGYIRDLIEADLSGKTGPVDALSTQIITELTERLCGALDAQDMAEKLGDQNQPRKLREMLVELLASLKGDNPWQGMKPMTKEDTRELREHVEKQAPRKIKRVKRA